METNYWTTHTHSQEQMEIEGIFTLDMENHIDTIHRDDLDWVWYIR